MDRAAKTTLNGKPEVNYSRNYKFDIHLGIVHLEGRVFTAKEAVNSAYDSLIELFVRRLDMSSEAAEQLIKKALKKQLEGDVTVQEAVQAFTSNILPVPKIHISQD